MQFVYFKFSSRMRVAILNLSTLKILKFRSLRHFKQGYLKLINRANKDCSN